jgi:hypothetical protein
MEGQGRYFIEFCLLGRFGEARESAKKLALVRSAARILNLFQPYVLTGENFK